MAVQRYVIGNFKDTEAAFTGTGSPIVNRALDPAADGIIDTFALEGRPRQGSLAVYVNGVRQREGIAYSATYAPRQTIIAFDAPPPNGAWLIADFYE